jgi:hypothetical protein
VIRYLQTILDASVVRVFDAKCDQCGGGICVRCPRQTNHQKHLLEPFIFGTSLNYGPDRKLVAGDCDAYQYRLKVQAFRDPDDLPGLWKLGL